MTRWSRICLLLFCMAQGAGLSGAVVQAARLNVRVAPAPDAPIVASLSAGTRVDTVPENEHWAEIAAPEGVPVWVASLFVAADGSLRKGARLRCGPGTVFAEYRIGTLPPEPVSVMEKSHDGFWLRIRPVPGLKCFISRRFLKEDSSGRKPAPPPPPPEKRSEPFRPVTGDEHPVSLEGTLVPLQKNVLDSAYELILEINGEVIPVCYLTAPRLNLKLWENRTVRIDGIQRWVKGIPRPFVSIEKVSPSWK